jgi:BirA family biotin operon repressor/biotin-[acetyl-CoA-carboxylase] ligase
MIDEFRTDRIRKRLIGKWGTSLTVRQSTASTMDDAFAAAADGAGDGHVELADEQTHGRGAHGRLWISPPGSDLYFSVVMRIPVEPASIALVTLASGLGVRDAVAAFLPGCRVLVRWPNDVWIEGRKCGGVLVESRTVGMSIDTLILGVGLNVNRTEWPAELEGIATSMRAERGDGGPFDRVEVLASVLYHMEQWVHRFVEHGSPVVINALRQKLALVGELVRFEDGEGVFEGIDEDGAARVRTDAGVVKLRAGHIEPVKRRA